MKTAAKLSAILLIFCNANCFGQWSAAVASQKLDSVLSMIKSFCPEYGSSREIKKKKIKLDGKMIRFLNHFYNDELSIDEIKEETISKFGSVWYGSDEIEIGNLTLYEERIKSEGNLRVFVKIATFNGKIVSKQIHIETKTTLDCKNPYEPWLSMYDIPYLKQYCFPLINFPVSIFVYNREIVADTDMIKNVIGIDNHYLVLLTGDSAKFFNNLTWHSFTSYGLGEKDNPLRMYINLSRVDLLEKLLYSPNHIIAIYAYEALKDKMENLSNETKSQMNNILNSSIKVHWFSGDVGRYGKTYKELVSH